MTVRVTDTNDDANEAQLQVLRGLSAEQRSQLAAQWSDKLREIAMQGVRDRHREFGERRVLLEYARITLGERLFQEAFGSEATRLR